MIYYRIYGKAIFPEGIAPGESKGLSNMLTAARNGNDTPILRGSAMAGALRSAFAALTNRDCADKWFGMALGKGKKESQDSLVYVADMPLDTGIGDSNSEYRTHNMNNRHTGSVVQGGLFTLEAYPPNTKGDFLLYVKGSGNEAQDESFVDSISQVLGSTLYLGGNRNRGIGRLAVENTTFAKFDTSTKEGMAQWLNVRYEDRKGNFSFCKSKTLDISASSNALTLDVQMQIPRGEDLVIGYGTSINNLQSEPQFTVKTDGKRYWRIPGSAFRGVFRSWMSRLAAREGKLTADTHERWVNNKKMTGELLGNAFGEKNDPIMDLFGTLFKRGRIHFSDAYSEKIAEEKDTQLRMHVAVDRFSGGANDGGLFGNKVLVGGLKFNMRVSVESPSADEKKWLLQTFKAMNLGVISFGSSKASGLLEVANINEIEKILG